MARYQSEREIEKVVRAFETCETDADEFKHAEHLLVAVWYQQTLDLKEAVDRMRTALFRFLDHHEVDRKQYNETITVFWIAMVAQKLNELGAKLSLVEKCNQIVELLGNDLPLQYYSPELLWSDEARQSFVSPDLKVWQSPEFKL